MKIMLKMLVGRGCGVNIIGCRGMSLGTKSNSCRKGFEYHVGMEMPNGSVDGKHIRVRIFTEIINIVLVSLVRCSYNELYGVTRDGANHNFVDYFWEPSSI